MLEEATVERVVEPDALEADTGDFEGADGVELAGLVDILRGGVLAAGEGLLDEGLRCLQGSTDSH